MPSVKRCKPLLGTYVTIQLSADLSPDALMDLANRAFAEITEIESKMSFHDAQSELSYLNREATKHPCRISADMWKVLNTALQLSRQTQGRYDISIAPELIQQGLLPGTFQADTPCANWSDISLQQNQNQHLIYFNRPLTLDLGGIAKGYAVDKAYEAIADSVDNLVINAGGDLRMKSWHDKSIAIKTPAAGVTQTVSLAMHASAVATTAGYYLPAGCSAIIDPDTRDPLYDDRSVTVFAPTCMLADALTKVALLAPNASDVLESKQAKAVFIDQAGTVQNG